MESHRTITPEVSVSHIIWRTGLHFSENVTNILGLFKKGQFCKIIPIFTFSLQMRARIFFSFYLASFTLPKWFPYACGFLFFHHYSESHLADPPFLTLGCVWSVHKKSKVKRNRAAHKKFWVALPMSNFQARKGLRTVWLTEVLSGRTC